MNSNVLMDIMRYLNVKDGSYELNILY